MYLHRPLSGDVFYSEIVEHNATVLTERISFEICPLQNSINLDISANKVKQKLQV